MLWPITHIQILVIFVYYVSCVPCCRCYQYDIVIDVDPIGGQDTDACIQGNATPCQTLSWTFRNDHRRNSTLYRLKEGSHVLDSPTETFKGLSKLAIVGNSSNVMINCTVENSGLAFEEVKDVRFESLTFFNCSAVRNSTSVKRKQNNGSNSHSCYEMYQTKVALYFYICSGIEMVHVSVSHSPNATGVIMYNTVGTNTFINSTFEYNQLSEGNTELPGGGGVYVEFTYCIPSNMCTCTYDNYSNLPDEITQHNHNAMYNFDNCTFSNNIANSMAHVQSTQKDGNNKYIIPHKQSHVAFGRGGGLSIMTKGNAASNTFNVTNCILENNRAIWGGGLLTSFMDVSLNNSVFVMGTVFRKNSCHSIKGIGGGGMRIVHYIFQTKSFDLPGNQVKITQCNFTENDAVSGGGLSISPTLQFFNNYSQVVKLNISRSCFENNTAKIGAAVEVTLFPILVHGGEPRIYIGDCKFLNNVILILDKNESASETGVGAVYTNGVILNFRGEALFEQNNGSALAVVGRRVSFENCTAKFIGNHGRSGGAIHLLGVAYILVNDNTNMIFQRNRAEVFGGAIRNRYIERENLVTNPNCFLRHSDSFRNPNEWGAHFYFEDNRGGLLHNDTIYTTSKIPCSWPGWDGSATIMCGENFTYCRNNQKTNCTSEIRTDAGSIQTELFPPGALAMVASRGVVSEPDPQKNLVSEQSFAFQHDSLKGVYPILTVIPGKPFQLPLKLKDDFGHSKTTTTVFAARVYSPNIPVAEVDPRFAYTSGGYLQINGISNNTVQLHLDTISERTWHVAYQVTLLDCPSGFIPSDDPPKPASTCRCNPSNYQRRLRCDQADFQSFLRNGYWMGTTPESNGSLVVSLCLPGFCTVNSTADYIKLPSNIDDLCKNRTGILCGKCIPGYGIAVNWRIFECFPCNNTNNAAHATYYALAVYVPLLILFTGIILLNVRLTTGPANAFIFYSQIISSTFDLTGDDHIPLNLVSNSTPVLLGAYRIPYGIFNLDFLENFIPPLCMGTGLNALDALQLDYIVACFPLIMILLVLLALKVKTWLKSLCSRFLQQVRRRHQLQDYTSEVLPSPTLPVDYSRFPSRTSFSCVRWFQNWQAGESLLHAFSAFLLLSYTKFALTSSYIVNLHPIVSADGSQVGLRRAYYAGQFTEHDVTYLVRYYIPSCFIIVIIAIIPIMLLGYPIIWLEKCIDKVNWIWRWYPVTKIHVFMDTFQGCYRDDRRFFAAMYFLFRLTINVGYILTDTWLQQFVVQQIACTVFIVIFLLCWPYREEKWIFNYVDFLMLSNLAVVNALSLYLFAFSQTNHGLPLPKSAFVFQYILVFLPLIYMVLYIIWHLLSPARKEKFRKLFRKITGRVKVNSSSRRRRAVHQISNPSFYSPINAPVNTATHTSNSHNSIYSNTVRPTIITATDLDFIEDDSFSDCDEEEAMLARAQDRNMYKPPKTKKDMVQEQQQIYIKRDLPPAAEQRQSDSPEGGTDGNQDDEQGHHCHMNGEKRDQAGITQTGPVSEASTKDSGFTTCSRTNTGNSQCENSQRENSTAERRDFSEREEFCSSPSPPKDYGTMSRV